MAADTNEAPGAPVPPTGSPAPAAPAQPSQPVPSVDGRISIDDFMKVELRVARVLAAERVPKSNKLLKLQVDVGSEHRTIVAGIAEAYEPETLVGRTVVVVFNLIANLALIPRFGYVGAAWVTVLSEFVLLVPFQLAAARVAPGVSVLAEVRYPLLATLLMAPVVWWLRDAVHPLVAIAAGAAVYPAALWALGGIDTAQWQLLRQLVPTWAARAPQPRP